MKKKFNIKYVIFEIYMLLFIKNTIIKSISTFIIILLTVILFPIIKIIRRNKDIWIFGALDGNEFAGNPKHLFLYVNKYHREIRTIWLSKNNKLILILRKRGYESYYIYSFKGFYYSLIAGYVFCSNMFLYDVNLIAINGAIKINLFHGIPIKKIVEDARSGRSNDKKLRNIVSRIYLYLSRIYSRFEVKLTDYVIACSVEHQSKMCSAFKKQKNSTPITGYPRNDAMFSLISSWEQDNLLWEELNKKIKFKYLITYLPTYRDSKRSGGVDLFTPYGFDKEYINQTLEQLNAVLIIKAHAAGALVGLNELKSSRIIFASNSQLPDVYPLLNKTNVLLTDLSSVYLDYLLLDRLIVFTAFDMKDYINNERQLYYDYDEVTPGPKAYNWKEVFNLIKNNFENDEWKLQREAIRNKFHKYIDNNSSERVFNFLNKLT